MMPGAERSSQYAERRKLLRQPPAFELLAREAEMPVEAVARLYENELAKLEVGARIRGFLPILATKKVRDMLRQSKSAKLSLVAGRQSMEWKVPRSSRRTWLDERLHQIPTALA